MSVVIVSRVKQEILCLLGNIYKIALANKSNGELNIMFAKRQSNGVPNGLPIVSLRFVTYERIEGKSN